MRILLLAIAFGWATHTRASWEAAKAAYDRGDFQVAADTYRALRVNGRTSAALEYNLGNALFRAGRPEEAIVAYRRAQWLSPNDPDLRANFARVAELGRVSIPPLPWFRRAAAVLSIEDWQQLWFAACWLLAAFGILRRWLRPLREAALWLFPVLILIVGLAMLGVFASRPVGIPREGVLRGGEVTARFEPLEDATAHFALPAGSIVEVGESVRDWVRIRSGENTGWVRASQVLRLSDG